MNEIIRQSLIDNESVPEVMRILSAKSDKWGYEEEIRLYSSLRDKDPIDGLYYQNFDKIVKLKEVFIGANAEISQRTLLQHMQPCKDVKVTKARIGFREFDIVPQKDRSLWYVPEDSGPTGEDE